VRRRSGTAEASSSSSPTATPAPNRNGSPALFGPPASGFELPRGGAAAFDVGAAAPSKAAAIKSSKKRAKRSKGAGGHDYTASSAGSTSSRLASVTAGAPSAPSAADTRGTAKPHSANMADATAENETPVAAMNRAVDAMSAPPHWRFGPSGAAEPAASASGVWRFGAGQSPAPASEPPNADRAAGGEVVDAPAALRALRRARDSADAPTLRAALFDALPFRDDSEEMTRAIAQAQVWLRQIKQSQRSM